MTMQRISVLPNNYGIPYNTVKYWIKKYNRNGMDALLKPRSGGKYITYDPSLKLRVTEYCLEHPEVSSSQIPETFRASHGAGRSWRKVYLEQGADALRKQIKEEKIQFLLRGNK